LSKSEFLIQTFTMTASPAEDRLRLDAVNAGGLLQAIWITRRLADRFIPHLAKHAEKQAEASAARDLVLSMQQEQLRSERAASPIPAVRLQPAIVPWLCQTIQLKERPEGLIWTMSDDGLSNAHMVLTGENVRALLDIFLTSYRKLEWSEQGFPDWALEAAAPKVGVAATLN
jgi:hypothetical protein